jgi:hypothetical protein
MVLVDGQKRLGSIDWENPMILHHGETKLLGLPSGVLASASAVNMMLVLGPAMKAGTLTFERVAWPFSEVPIIASSGVALFLPLAFAGIRKTRLVLLSGLFVSICAHICMHQRNVNHNDDYQPHR